MLIKALSAAEHSSLTSISGWWHSPAHQKQQQRSSCCGWHATKHFLPDPTLAQTALSRLWLLPSWIMQGHGWLPRWTRASLEIPWHWSLQLQSRSCIASLTALNRCSQIRPPAKRSLTMMCHAYQGSPLRKPHFSGSVWIHTTTLGTIFSKHVSWQVLYRPWHWTKCTHRSLCCLGHLALHCFTLSCLLQEKLAWIKSVTTM